MSIARTQKEENAKVLREELSEAPHAILVDFKGLNVEGATDLRRKLREGDARFKVVKNSTMQRAVEDLPLAELSDAFVGQTAIAYTDGDVVALAKVLSEFAKDFDTPNFKAGIVDGAPISQEQFEQLAKLPPREQLIAKALYLMNYPITGFATALNNILRGFVVVLDQIREKREAAGESAAVETEAAPAEAPAAEPEEAPAEQAEAEAESEAPAEEAPAEEAGAEAAPAEEAEATAAEAEEPPAEEAEAEAAAEPEEAAADEQEPSEDAGEEATEEEAEEEDKS